MTVSIYIFCVENAGAMRLSDFVFLFLRLPFANDSFYDEMNHLDYVFSMRCCLIVRTWPFLLKKFTFVGRRLARTFSRSSNCRMNGNLPNFECDSFVFFPHSHSELYSMSIEQTLLLSNRMFRKIGFYFLFFKKEENSTAAVSGWIRCQLFQFFDFFGDN